ncbi:hypothetical protein [Streptomyces tanashiensis]|uniref:Uncharacterized protein n=1 Tax=Streptomyces tanashiensis TaxID=67367 RepID=A0ABY6QS13_9ACTN|nr:hypothetical protein [Streptomyces tanashiensis]UZX19569.1 hypothetical protein LDH80_01930 [Streptomyces tanashiensis]GGY17907.1 hypothetical protein GCM10010299_24130 [Streptomyces tanashiensis]
MSSLFDAPEPRQIPPGDYPLWDEALALVNRDLAVTLPEQGPLRLLGLPAYDGGGGENVYVALANGEWHGNFLEPAPADNPACALSVVTDAAQETVTERLWQAWPLCGEHHLGMHPREVDGRLSWWCAGAAARREAAHIRAAVGGLDALVRPHRPNRKRRRRG